MGLEQQLATQARQRSEEAMEMATRTEIEQYSREKALAPLEGTYTPQGRSPACRVCQEGSKWKSLNTLQRILNSIAHSLGSGAPSCIAVITGFLLFFALLGLVILCYGLLYNGRVLSGRSAC